MDTRSGSLQSSSGADVDEYDSRAAVDSGFMSGGRVSDQQFFDPLDDYLHQNGNRSLSFKESSVMNNPVYGGGAAAGMPSPRIQAAASEEPAAARNSKKRSRASRRAPTTVLTTDTTNFRAMVQEFTGIPSLSFGNSPFTRRRLDLFASRPGPSETTAAGHYFRFPFAEKVQFPATRTPSSAAAAAVNHHHNMIGSVSSTDSNQTPSSSLNFYNSNLSSFNQNPPFTSLVQSNPRFPFSISPLLGSKPDLVSLSLPSISEPKMGFFDEQQQQQFSQDHHPSAARQTLIFSDQIPLQNEQNDGRLPQQGDKDTSISLNGGECTFLRDTSASTSSFPSGKSPEASGREGTFGSWICSSPWK